MGIPLKIAKNYKVIRLHTKNQLPRCSGSGLKVYGGWGVWFGVDNVPITCHFNLNGVELCLNPKSAPDCVHLGAQHTTDKTQHKAVLNVEYLYSSVRMTIYTIDYTQTLTHC